MDENAIEKRVEFEVEMSEEGRLEVGASSFTCARGERPMKVTLLGRDIGTCCEVDGFDDFYMFQLFESCVQQFPSCACLSVNVLTGEWAAYDEDGEEEAKGFIDPAAL